MIIRILTVREHKTVIFCDICDGSASRKQLLIDKSIYPDMHICTGDVIDGELVETTSKKGDAVVFLKSVRKIINHHSFSPYRSYEKGMSNEENININSAMANMLNGGTILIIELLKKEILDYIDIYMRAKNISRVYTPITTPYRGTSMASPLKADGQYTGPKYIKITHELGLKMSCYLMLKSVYEVGYVCRDRYETKENKNEFLSVEGVVISEDKMLLCDLFYKIWEKSTEVSHLLGIETASDMKDIVIVDFIKEFGGIPQKSDYNKAKILYDKLIETNKHMIINNAPIDSPFVYTDEDKIPLETKWIYKGKGIGHGYDDEYRIEKIKMAFDKQKNDLDAMGIESELPADFLNVLAMGGFPTRSFVIGVERLVSDVVGVGD